MLKKVNRNIGILWKIRNSLNESAKLLLYYALIHSHLHYGNCVWGIGSRSEMRPLISAQKKVIRIISNSHYHAHTSPLFKNVSILKIGDINNLATAKFVHSQLNSLSPIVQYVPGRNVHNYSTRSAILLRPARHNVAVTKKFIFKRGCHIWNNLPEDFKNIQNVVSFKIKAKKFYLNRYV